MKTYNELYINTRNTLKRAEIEAYALEARVLVASAARCVSMAARNVTLPSARGFTGCHIQLAR